MSMTDFNQLYKDYANYNILYNQLNFPSPSVEYAWRKTKKIIEEEVVKIVWSKVINKKISIADIGCGNGALLIRIAQSLSTIKNTVKLKGFDLAEPFVTYGKNAAKYKKLKNLAFTMFDFEKEKIKEKFDIIICSEVLEHLKNPSKFLVKLHDMLEDGGYLVLTTPNSKNLIKYPFFLLKKYVVKKDEKESLRHLTEDEQRFKLAELEQHLHVFSNSELKKLLYQSRFHIVRNLRSTTLFGGPFLDNHIFLFALSLIFDSIINLFPVPQIGWDNIIIAKKF